MQSIYPSNTLLKGSNPNFTHTSIMFLEIYIELEKMSFNFFYFDKPSCMNTELESAICAQVQKRYIIVHQHPPEWVSTFKFIE